MASNQFDIAAGKRKELLLAFERLSATTIYGVVGTSGPSGRKIPPETCWSLYLRLIAWRVPGTPVQRTPLSVARQVADTELKDWRAAIQAESVIAFRGKLCEQSPFGDPRALLIELLERPGDEELEAVLSEYRRPVEIEDSVLGMLSLNKSTGSFTGKTDWLGRQVDIAVIVDENGDVSDSLRTAKGLLGDVAHWAAKASNYAADKLLENKNNNWLGERELPVSREDFIGRMRLRSITAYPEGKFELWHDDGEMFGGHSILVSGSLTNGMTAVDTPG